MTRDIVYALRKDSAGHIVIAHMQGYILDDRLAIYHQDSRWWPYWWVIDRKTGIGIERVGTLSEVKKLIDNGILKHDYERIVNRITAKNASSYEKNIRRMRNHLNNIREGNGVSVMSNRPDCGHETYKEALNL